MIREFKGLGGIYLIKNAGLSKKPSLVMREYKSYHCHNSYQNTEGEVYKKEMLYGLSVIVKYIPVEKITPIQGKDVGYHQG